MVCSLAFTVTYAEGLWSLPIPASGKMSTYRRIKRNGKDLSLDTIYWIFNNLCILHNAPYPDLVERAKLERKHRYHTLYKLIVIQAIIQACDLNQQYLKHPDQNPVDFFRNELQSDSPLRRKFVHPQWREQDGDRLKIHDESISRLAEHVSGYVGRYQQSEREAFARKLEYVFRSIHPKIQCHEQITQLPEGSWECVVKECECGPETSGCVLVELP